MNIKLPQSIKSIWFAKKLLVIALFCTCINAKSQTASTVSLNGTSSTNTVSKATATIVDPNLTIISDGTIAGFTVQITGSYTSGDVLSYTGSLPSGITVLNGGFYTTYKALQFAGIADAATWQDLLRRVTITTANVNCYPEQRQVSFIVGSKLYNLINGHFYEKSANATSWITGYNNAKITSYFGRQAYMVTITSAAENSLVASYSESWLGASDDYRYIDTAAGYVKYSQQGSSNGTTSTGSEGMWHWVTGPEKGTLFSIGNTSTSAPVTATGQYANWNGCCNGYGFPTEPNGNNGGENFGQMLSGGTGMWNDLNGTSNLNTIYEYGDMSTDDVSSKVVFTRTISLSGAPSGTIIGGNNTVCSGTNNTTIILSGLASGGTVSKWQSSTDNFITTTNTTDIANTTTSYTAINITKNTYYRALVNTTGCTNNPTSSTYINVNAAVPGNIVADNNTICNGANVTFTLNGYSGSIQKWQFSTTSNFTSNVTDISNTTPSMSYQLNTAGTYYFRAVVLSCSNTVYTNVYTISVVNGSAPVGGTVSSANFCGGSNSGSLSLTGSTGTVSKWQYSTDGGIVWTDVANTTTSLSYSAITATRRYKASLTNGACGTAVSNPGIITVSSASVAGTASGAASVCAGTNSTNLSLSGSIGTIQWQSSTDNSTFNNIVGATSSSYTATDLSATTYYRAVVTNGVCTAANSNSIAVTVKQTSTSTTNLSICPSALPYVWNGLTFNATGSQTKLLTNSVGCDSAATLNLTVNSTSTSTTNVTICSSALPYTWNGLTFSATGSQTKHLTNSVGCDSAATLNLTVLTSTTSTTDSTVCPSALPFSWNGLTFTAAGTQVAHLTNADGCDSLATFNLTVLSTSTNNLSICPSALPFSWNGLTFNAAGTQTAYIATGNGCDSLATLNLTVNNTSTSTTTLTTCNSLVWNGTTYTNSGTYTYISTNAAGCDSTATLNLTVKYSSTSSTTATVCDSLTWNGIKYTTSGTYTIHFNNAVGCDSAAILNLIVNYSTSSLITTTVCDSIIWNGNIYRNSGTYTYHTTNAVGCDSTATLVLTVNYKPTVAPIAGLTNIEILAIGGGGGAGGPDGTLGAGGGAGGAVYGSYTLSTTGSNIYTVAVGGGGGFGQGCSGNAAGGTAGVNGGAKGGNAGNGGCSGAGGGSGGWSGLYQGSNYIVVAGGGAGGGGSNEGTANDVTTPGGGNQSAANGTSMTGQNGTDYSGDGGGGGAGGGGYYGGAGQSNLTQTGYIASQAWGGANYTSTTGRNSYANYVGNSGATASTGTGGLGTTSTITNASNFNYANTYGKGGNAQGNSGTSTTANGNNGVVIIRYLGLPVATGGTITQSGGYTLHTFTNAGSNTFTASSVNAVCVGSTALLNCATAGGVWKSSDTTIAQINPSTGMVTGIAAGIVTITYTVTNANGCVGSSTKTLTVNPLPNATISGTTAVCRNSTSPNITFTGSNATAPYTFTYTINGGTNQTVTTTSGNSVTVSVPTSVDGTYVYSLVSVKDASSTTCTNTASGSATITVNSLPTASISGIASVCLNGTSPNITFTGASGTSPYTFTYKINSGSNQTVTTASGNSVNVAAPTSTAGSFAYSLISVVDASTTACSQTQGGTATITVNPLPTASITGTTTVCQNTLSPNITFTGSNTTAPYTFTYTINGGANQTVTTTSGNSVTVSAPTSFDGIFTYSLVSVKDASSTTCINTASGSATVTVKVAPVVAAITGANAVCISSNIQLSNDTTTGYWTSGTPGVASISTTGLVTGLSGGTSNISYTVVNALNCSTTVVKTITVNTLPVVAGVAQAGAFGNGLNFDGSNDYVNLSRTIQDDFTIEFWMKTTQTGNSGSMWYNGMGLVDAEYPGGTNDFGVSLVGNKIAFGVGNPDYTIFSTSAVNTGNWVHVAATRNKLSGLMQLYINGVLESSYTQSNHNSLNAPSYIYLGKDNNGTFFNGTLDELRLWNSVRSSQDINNNKNVELSGTQTGLVNYFKFNQGVAGGSNSGVTTLTDAVGTNSQPLSNFALTGTTSNWVTGAQATSAALGNVCVNSTIQLSNATVGGVWSSSDSTIASISSTGLVTGKVAGTVTMNYTVTNANNCSTTASTSVTVNPLPTANIIGSTTLCQNLSSPSITFTGGNATAPYTFTYTISAGTNQTVTTTSGNSATVSVPTSVAGTYVYSLVSVKEASSTTCSANVTGSATVVVNPKPTAGADINYLCGGATQTLTGTADTGTWTAMITNPIGATLSSTISGVATVSFANLATGTFNYIYALSTGCSDTMSIVVRPKPNAGADQSICILNGTTGVTLTSNVTGSWSAKSGNAGTSSIATANAQSTLVNNFSAVGDYNYINTNNGCTDTVKVTIRPAGSIGNYVWKDQNNDGLQNEPASNGVNNITVELYKKDGNGAFNLYASTTTANNVNGNPGYYNFGLCEDGVYKVKVPTVNPFTQTHLTAQNATTAMDGNSDVDPADGFGPEVNIDTHGSGVAKDNNTIDIGYQICTKPIAGSDFNTCGGQLVAITGQSTTPALPTTDGNWSAASGNPVGATLGTTILGVATIQFDSLASGVYSFIYTVTGGCDDTLHITVNPKPSAGLDVSSICGGQSQTVSGLPSNGTWSQLSSNALGATVGSTSNGTSTINFTNASSGIYTFIYTVPSGCSDTMTINAFPKPDAGIDVYMECGTPRLFDSLRASIVGGTWSAMADNPTGIILGSSADGKAQISLPIAPTQGTWKFIYTVATGCTDTMSYVIGVTGNPAPAINGGSNSICGSSSVQLCPTQWGWSNYQWYKDGVAVSGNNGVQACITIDTSGVGSYTLSATNGSACWSKQSAAVVVSLAGAVMPTITVQGGSTTSCNNGSITLISSSQNNNQWNKDGIAISGATSQYYTATTSGNYTVTATNCGFTTTSAATTVTIVPQINVSSIQSNTGTVCTGSSITLTNTTVGGVWSSNNSAVATVNSNGVVSGVSIGSVMITYTVTISGCSNSSSYTLNVADGSNISAPSIAAQGSTGLCGSSTVQICPTVWGWNNYQWYQNGVAVTQNGTGACITVDTSKLGSYTLTATNSSGCWSSASNAVVVAPASTPATPVITAGGTTSTCNGQPVSLTSSGSTGNQWYKDGIAISGATSPTYAATASGVYNVTVTDNCGGVATSAGTSVTVTAYITLSSIQSISGTVCKGGISTLTNTTTGGLWSSNNSSLATVDAITGVVTGVDTGSVVITYTVSSGSCSNAVSATFTVVDGSNVVAPVIIAQSDSNICLNGNVTLCPTSFGLSNYQWYKNGVAIGQYGVGACITVDTSALGRYTLTGTNGSGCLSPISNSILVSTASTAAAPTVTVNGPASTCNGQPVSLTSSASNSNQWKKDGIAISGATGQTYQTAVTGVYTVTSTNQCGSSATSNSISISVGPYITVNSIQSVTASVCKNATSTLINTTPGGVWTSNNTSVATVDAITGLLTGVDTGIVTIAYTVTVNGCSNAVYATFTIVDGSNVVAPVIVAQSDSIICINGNVTLCPTSFGFSNYQWYKNGIAISQNGYGACITVDTSKLGSYTLTGTAGNGCWSAQSNAILVSKATAPTTPTISASGSTSICSGSSVTLTSNSASDNQWYKNGVAISGATSQSYIAITAGTYTVKVTNCGGNSTSAGATVTVASPIILAAISGGSSNICSGTSITLTDSTTGGVWSSSNTAVATINSSGVVTSVSAGTVTITYTVIVGSCSKSVTTDLTIVSGSSITPPTIVAQGLTTLCGSNTVQLCPSAYGWSNYQWYKNGVAVTTNGASACIVIDTAKLGSYTLAATMGVCWTSQSNAISITTSSAPATPTISASGSTSICSGSSVLLTSSAASGNQWNKNGVAISTATSQTYTATTAGTYTVTVTTCGSTSSAGTTVTVNASPVVAPITGSTNVCLGSTITLADATAGGTWASINTAIATVSGGVVTPLASGKDTITYTKISGGCSTVASITINVSGSVATPTLDIRGSVNICGSGSLQICPLVWGYSNYQWYKNGVAYSTASCITVNTAGAYTLTGTNGSGCWSSPSAAANVTINALPTVVATTGATSVCAGSTTTLTNTSTIPSGGTGVWSTSSTSLVNVNASTGAVRGVNSGSGAVISYTVTSALGCSNTATYIINVRAIPGVPSIQYAPGTPNPQTGAGGAFCANKTFTVVGNPTGGVWSSTGVLSVTTPGGVVNTGSVAGAASLAYTYTDAYGCSNSRSVNLNVAVCPGGRGIANSNSNAQLTKDNDFTMYPNPARSTVSLQVDKLVGAGNIVITDLYGKQVKSQSLSMGTNTIDVSNLAKGFYLVSTITEQGKTTKKLVVE